MPLIVVLLSPPSRFFLPFWIREGMGLTANNVYKLHFEFSEKTLYGVVSGESHLSSHPPPQVRKRLGVSGVRDAFFSSELNWML